MINIEKIQAEIDKTDYWDAPIYDIQSHYFGDEIYIYIDDRDDVCWKISFLSCYKVTYETDANLRKIVQVKAMRSGQLGYWGQNIEVSPYIEDENFIQCNLDLSSMTMVIACKDISVEKLKKSELSFFWEKNK